MTYALYEGTDPRYTALQDLGYLVVQDSETGLIRISPGEELLKTAEANLGSKVDASFLDVDPNNRWVDYTGNDPYYNSLQTKGFKIQYDPIYGQVQINGKVETPEEYFMATGKERSSVLGASNLINVNEDYTDWKGGNVVGREVDLRSVDSSFYKQEARKAFDKSLWEKFKIAVPKYSWGVGVVDATLFLLAYEMEAVSFTEYLYYEAVRWGTRLIKTVYLHRDTRNLFYFAEKIYQNVWCPAYSFHLTWGPLNPFSYDGYEVVYRYYWEEIRKYTGAYFDDAFGFEATENSTFKESGSDTIGNYTENGTSLD